MLITINIIVQPSYNISGLVTLDGAALAGATVTATTVGGPLGGSRFTGTTAANGTYVLGLTAGTYQVAASKSGLIALTKTWALEFARYGIRANAVAPGFTDTEMMRTIPEEVLGKIVAKVPLKRLARPEEIAAAYVFLASDEAAFITGQVLFVDGGLTTGF